jgi:hypothetical protein
MERVDSIEGILKDTFVYKRNNIAYEKNSSRIKVWNATPYNTGIFIHTEIIKLFDEFQTYFDFDKNIDKTVLIIY